MPACSWASRLAGAEGLKPIKRFNGSVVAEKPPGDRLVRSIYRRPVFRRDGAKARHTPRSWLHVGPDDAGFSPDRLDHFVPIHRA